MQSPVPFARIGTRGSPLALAQANLVRQLLAQSHGIALDTIEVIAIATTGDKLTDRPLSEAGGKGLFTKEIDNALLSGAIDIGVHSTKDVASVLPDGLILPVFLAREDVRDAFISLISPSVEDLPQGARFGTSSIRRAAQLLSRRPDLVIVPFRGNVQTRLQKLADGVADATLLAAAGLNRLNQGERITQYLDPTVFMPAPAQGAIGLSIRDGDTLFAERVAPLDHELTNHAIVAERGLLGRLDGSCRTPIGAWTETDGETLILHGQILNLDGTLSYQAKQSGHVSQSLAIGDDVGRQLLDLAGSNFLSAWAEP